MANIEKQENLQVKAESNKQQIDAVIKSQENLQTKVENNKQQIDARGLPEGGKAGQFLKKKTDSDFDCEWSDAGSTSSDNNSIVEVNKSSLLTTNELLIAYRIGYMIVIEAIDVSIKTPSNPSPYIEIGHINKIPGFNFVPCTTVYASYDVADGEYTGYGIAGGDVDQEAGDGRYVIFIRRARRTSYSDINFSMIIPLYDDPQTSG